MLNARSHLYAYIYICTYIYIYTYIKMCVYIWVPEAARSEPNPAEASHGASKAQPVRSNFPGRPVVPFLRVRMGPPHQERVAG